MPDAAYFRQQAEHCRNMAKIAIKPDLRMQLLMFAYEFDEKARELDALSESPAWRRTDVTRAARASHAESAGLGSSCDPQIPEAERPSATRREGRAEPSDGDCMSRSSAKIAPIAVMIGAALALTSCAGDKTDGRSDMAGWRHRDGSAVSDLEFAQASGACRGQTTTVLNPDSAPFDTTMNPAFALLNALTPPPPPSSTPDDPAQFEACLDSKGIHPAP
jgi:hypothetical protein